MVRSYSARKATKGAKGKSQKACKLKPHAQPTPEEDCPEELFQKAEKEDIQKYNCHNRREKELERGVYTREPLLLSTLNYYHPLLLILTAEKNGYEQWAGILAKPTGRLLEGFLKSL